MAGRGLCQETVKRYHAAVHLDAVLQLVEAANEARLGAAAASGAAEATLERAFGCSRHLATYGTLAPGERNHHLLAPCPGTWTRGEVTGWRAARDFPVFTYAAAAPRVRVFVLESGLLVPHWARLDAFEDPDYRRILVPVFAGAQLAVVANLYAAREQVPPTGAND